MPIWTGQSFKFILPQDTIAVRDLQIHTITNISNTIFANTYVHLSLNKRQCDTKDELN